MEFPRVSKAFSVVTAEMKIASMQTQPFAFANWIATRVERQQHSASERNNGPSAGCLPRFVSTLESGDEDSQPKSPIVRERRFKIEKDNY